MSFNKVEIDPILGTVLGAGHLAVNIGYLVSQDKPDALETTANVLSLLPELCAFARMKAVVDGTEYLSLLALCGLDFLYGMFLIGAAADLTS